MEKSEKDEKGIEIQQAAGSWQRAAAKQNPP
jgi:hypothetical protein